MHEILLTHYQALLPRSRGQGLCLGTFGSYGTEQLRVICGAGWKELAVTATFHPAQGDPVSVLVPADGVVNVPHEATACAADGQDASAVIVFSGTADGVQRISADLAYTVLPHAEGFGASAQADGSHAYVLDWHGNGFFSGYVQARNDFRLLSPNGTRYRLYVDDDGTLHTEMTL